MKILIDLREQIIDQKRNILMSFPERGDPNGNNIQTIIEIIPELALLDHRLQILIRSRNDPGIDPDPVLTTDPFEFHFLEDPEKFCLEIQGHFADFIQKDRAVTGQLKLPQFPIDGPGKGPFFMTKQFRLQECFHNGGTVHGNIGFIRRRVVMNYLGNEFLPRTALALNQNRRLALGNNSHGFKDFTHLPARSDNVTHFKLSGRFHEQAIDLFFHFIGFDGFLDGYVEFIDVDGFMDVIKGTSLHSLDGRVHVMMGGDHNHFDIFIFLAQIFEYRKAVNIGQADIQNHDFRGAFYISIQSFCTGMSCHHIIAFLCQIQFESFSNRDVIINHENLWHAVILPG